MRLSQGQLNLLETCPRKFQHTYLEQLGAPTTPDQQARLMLGSRFHSLMQQWEMGLPVEPFIREDEQLNQWFTAFVGAAPRILELEAPTFRQSEHQRTLEVEGHLLTVVYDLLVMSDSQAQILDWKTYPKPLKSRQLAENWQTRLYPFVLAETSHYDPGQISMTYWFFQSKSGEDADPQSLKFSYSSTTHQQTQRDLTQLLQRLSGWIDRYEQGESFPQVAEGSKQCADCSFATRCQRGDGEESTVRLPNFAEIQEIPL
ncbi:PD-(D/E)XK nuclease family protein [Phormidesmis sp. 146-35]